MWSNVMLFFLWHDFRHFYVLTGRLRHFVILGKVVKSPTMSSSKKKKNHKECFCFTSQQEPNEENLTINVCFWVFLPPSSNKKLTDFGADGLAQWVCPLCVKLKKKQQTNKQPQTRSPLYFFFHTNILSCAFHEAINRLEFTLFIETVLNIS